MKKWHITITNNETGDTELDIDTCAILAGIDAGDTTRVVHRMHGSTVDRVATISSVLKSIKNVRKENPIIDRMVYLAEKSTAADKGTEEN